MYVPEKSHGLRKDGIKFLQESMEALCHSVLGPQANLRWAIVDDLENTKMLQVQQDFEKLFDNNVLILDSIKTVTNARTAISSCTSILNLTIFPQIILLPSILIILRDPYPVFNNIIKNVDEGMNLSVNLKVNCAERIPVHHHIEQPAKKQKNRESNGNLKEIEQAQSPKIVKEPEINKIVKPIIPNLPKKQIEDNSVEIISTIVISGMSIKFLI